MRAYALLGLRWVCQACDDSNIRRNMRSATAQTFAGRLRGTQLPRATKKRLRAGSGTSP